MEKDNFKVVRSNLTTMKGKLFLQVDEAAFSIEGVRDLLKSPVFRQQNEDVIPIFEKGLKMMERGETGAIA